MTGVKARYKAQKNIVRAIFNQRKDKVLIFLSPGENRGDP